MIVIVDYGMGNLGSIKNMLKKIGESSLISNKKEDIASAEKLILPGVGAFDNGMENLRKLELIEVLNQKAMQEKIPVLGICLGMQLLANRSEEGKLQGLGWINAEVKRFSFDDQSRLKIPHMGWNTIKIKKESPLLKGLEQENRFYFVHSYHLECAHEQDILARTVYGYEFTSCVSRDNILGAQFHPEKSHKFGMQMLRNFSKEFSC